MEGIGLALAIVATFKEVYLLSKFIQQTVSSIRNKNVERLEIEKDFRTQMLFLQSLGQILFGGNGITNNAALDEVMHCMRFRIRCVSNTFQ
jgi:hypothetical protein